MTTERLSFLSASLFTRPCRTSASTIRLIVEDGPVRPVQDPRETFCHRRRRQIALRVVQAVLLGQCPVFAHSALSGGPRCEASWRSPLTFSACSSPVCSQTIIY